MNRTVSTDSTYSYMHVRWQQARPIPCCQRHGWVLVSLSLIPLTNPRRESHVEHRRRRRGFSSFIFITTFSFQVPSRPPPPRSFFFCFLVIYTAPLVCTTSPFFFPSGFITWPRVSVCFQVEWRLALAHGCRFDSAPHRVERPWSKHAYVVVGVVFSTVSCPRQTPPWSPPSR